MLFLGSFFRKTGQLCDLQQPFLFSGAVSPPNSGTGKTKGLPLAGLAVGMQERALEPRPQVRPPGSTRGSPACVLWAFPSDSRRPEEAAFLCKADCLLFIPMWVNYNLPFLRVLRKVSDRNCRRPSAFSFLSKQSC